MKKNKPPKLGKRVKISWADIESNSNTRPASLKLPVAENEGVLTEWNHRDPCGLKRCCLRTGIFVGDTDQLGDYLIIPMGVIIDWSYL